ncbi:hypothetical protein HCN51_48720 [Nonomuraea sp. FMUSA5-5]|uniref:OmpA-like domain-containing protein n=1 Tax=Nonomuraea composti TaxID=2720023 RepID=A0ABX1BHL6_9ACTN|nr:hypothetical protein [Nonomuraea sp. FMUSA5-5]NJP97226.1 hypothetical protein [Nonomuraea sp. FMUSA5-5]
MSDALRRRLAVDRARTAARSGDLDGAIRLLGEVGPPCADVPGYSGAGGDEAARADQEGIVAVLDLRARLHARRGELAEADRCWAAVQDLVPGHPGAEAGRRTIEEIRSGRRRARPLMHAGWLGVVAAAVAVVTLATGIVALGTGSEGTIAQGRLTTAIAPPGATAPPDATAVPSATASPGAAVSRADELREHIAAVEAGQAAEAERTARQAASRRRELAAIARKLTMPGVLVRRRSQDVRVRFREGLFPVSTEISDAGPALLRALGRRIAGMKVDTTVVGHAVPVPGGRTSGGSVVALGRALVAARHLAEGGRLPVTAFTLVSADQADNPFRDPRRNRTVTLLITPRT